MRSRFDQFVKQMTREGYGPAGKVETDAEVSPDARRIDLWFTPGGPKARKALVPLGLLGRLGRTACTLEPFHNTPGGIDVMDCVCKHHFFRDLLGRRKPAPPLPVQWILSSGRPRDALAGLVFKPSARWGRGFYEGPRLTNTRLVVIAELAVTRDTLLVRLMGAGRTLARALRELRALPPEAPERTLARQFCYACASRYPPSPRTEPRMTRSFS